MAVRSEWKGEHEAMVYKSSDCLLEVLVSDEPEPDGRFIVSAKQTTQAKIGAIITVDLGGKDNKTTLTYTPQGKKEWPVRGSHHGEVIRDVRIQTVREPEISWS